MTHETPNERRTRLIEQYAGLLEAGPTYRANVIASAIELADAVIAAAPQEAEPEPARQDESKDRYLLGQVRELIKIALDWYDDATPTETKNRLARILTMLREES
jgi:hypothetical protein